MLRQTLLVFGILSVAGAAMAADVTSPLYLTSEKGEAGSITSVGLRRVAEKNKFGYYTKSRQTILKEEIRYGITDSVTLLGFIGNTWDRWKGSWDNPMFKKRKDNENINWAAGLGWNVLSGPTRLQLSAQYGQDRLKNFDGEYKFITAETKFGYQFQKALPYITGGIEIPMFQKAGIKGIAGDKFIYNTKAGVYQGACEVWALDTGVRLTYDENRESRMVFAEAEASYYIAPKAALSIYGAYALDGRAKYDVDIHDKSIGTRLRYFF